MSHDGWFFVCWLAERQQLHRTAHRAAADQTTGAGAVCVRISCGDQLLQAAALAPQGGAASITRRRGPRPRVRAHVK